jgi:hypothetical protein
MRAAHWQRDSARARCAQNNYSLPSTEETMRASFLISVPAYSRLAPAASERGWRSDPDYARRTVERLLGRPGPRRELDGRPLADLAAMSGEFTAAAPDEVVRAIARFFGERPPRVEVEGIEYAVGPTSGALALAPG